jgi:hypothetical protein
VADATAGDLPTGYVRVADGVLTQTVTDEMVLLDLDSGFYFGLDAVATRMFELACELPDADSVVEQLETEFDAERPVLREDLEAFLGQLVEKGLVVRVVPGPSVAIAPGRSATGSAPGHGP